MANKDRPKFAEVSENADIRRGQIVEQLSKIGIDTDAIRNVPESILGALATPPDGTPRPILNKFSNSLAGVVTNISSDLHEESKRGRDALLAPAAHHARQMRLLDALDAKVAEEKENISGEMRAMRGQRNGADLTRHQTEQIRSKLSRLNQLENKAHANIGKLDSKFKAGADQRMQDIVDMGLDAFAGVGGITKKVGGKVVDRTLAFRREARESVVRNETREIQRQADALREQVSRRQVQEIQNPKSELSKFHRKTQAAARQALVDESFTAAEKTQAFNSLDAVVRQATKKFALKQFPNKVGPTELNLVASQKFPSQMLTAGRKLREAN